MMHIQGDLPDYIYMPQEYCKNQLYYFEYKLEKKYDYIDEYDAQGVFDIIHSLAQDYSMKELNWTMSERDEEYLDRIIEYWEDLDRIPQIIAEGVMQCAKKDDWRFGQIIYRAHTAIVNYEMQGYDV